MHLLISAYACAPHMGSEYAVGWTWVTGARRLGHKVSVLASSVYREAILAACNADKELADIGWRFPEVPGWRLHPGVEPRYERTYNLLWQLVAARDGAEIVARERVDAIHHASWAGIRAPTFLGHLGPPLVIGPIGGGETSPSGLRDRIGARGRILEFVRDLSSRTIAFNPIIRPGLRHAAVLFVSTPDTQRLFNGRLRQKTRVFSQLSLPYLPQTPPARCAEPKAPTFIFAGRLLYWKGVHIALQAFSQLLPHHPEARFTIIGDGPERSRLQHQAEALGIAGRVDFLSRMPQPLLFELYDRHSFLLFPSLHDSGGMVALEAMARGLPVVCLDLGGPGLLVNEASGLVISTAGRTTDEVAAAMAQAVLDALARPERLDKHSEEAIRCARKFETGERAGALYTEVANLVRSLTAGSDQTAPSLFPQNTEGTP